MRNGLVLSAVLPFLLFSSPRIALVLPFGPIFGDGDDGDEFLVYLCG